AIESLIGSLIVAALGAQSAVRRAVKVPPAEAMRPEPPARYRRSVFEVPWRRFRLPMATRMIVRNLERQPVRALTSITGISFAVAVLLVGLSFIDIMNELMDVQFSLAMRQDATLNFVEPRSGRALHEVEHITGVMDVEPMRSVPARFIAGTRSRTLGITGLPGEPTLNRIVDRSGQVQSLPSSGLVLSKILGEILGVRPGDALRVEVLTGNRQVLDVPVAQLVDDSMGLQAYMRLDALNRLVREGTTISGATMTVDPAQRARFYQSVKAMPAVAGVA